MMAFDEKKVFISFGNRHLLEVLSLLEIKRKSRFMENAETKYPYKDIPLTPTIIEELIEELFTGKLIVRQTIVDEVAKYHEKNGGAKSNAQNVPRSVKKALSYLRKKGLAENVTYGYWRIGSVDSIETIEVMPPTGSVDSIETIEVMPPVVIAEIPQSIADKIIGDGKSAVYLYYLPMYRQNAETSKETLWHCKIERSDRDPFLRVMSQAATALPEKPHIALIIKTNFASELETAIQSILIIHGRKIDSSPGSEWFLTSPDEVEKIAEIILNAL